MQIAAGGAVPAVASTLVQEVSRAMLLTKLKVSAAALLAVGAASSLAIVTVGFTQEKQKPAATPQAPPVSRRTAVILAKLEKRIPMEFPNAIPIDDVFKYIKQATRDGPNDFEIPIYLDPIGFQEAKKSLNSTISIQLEDTPLRVSLAQVLAQLDLAFVVKDDLVFISSPGRIERDRGATVALPRLLTPRTKAVLAQLDEPISMSFANETPLEDVVKYITQATTTANSPGIPIVVNAIGLEQARRKLQSTVQIDLEGVSLKTTMRLMLDQLGLAYTIKDGLLVISSPEVIEKVLGEPPRGPDSPPRR